MVKLPFTFYIFSQKDTPSLVEPLKKAFFENKETEAICYDYDHYEVTVLTCPVPSPVTISTEEENAIVNLIQDMNENVIVYVPLSFSSDCFVSVNVFRNKWKKSSLDSLPLHPEFMRVFVKGAHGVSRARILNHALLSKITNTLEEELSEWKTK